MNIFKHLFYFRLTASFMLIAFVSSAILPPSVCAQAIFNLPAPGTMVTASESFNPVLMKGLKVHADNPLLFDFIVDQGDKGRPQWAARTSAQDDVVAGHRAGHLPEIQRLIKYFLCALTIPEKDLWVNLSPYEKDRMINADLGKTEMGLDMLSQDYLLKQLTASMIYPEKDLGKAFWQKVYTKAQEQYGTTDIPVDTFNKVWIVAEKAKVFEKNEAAYVVGAHLKVMLDTDYRAEQENLSPTRGHVPEGYVSPSRLLSDAALDTKATQVANRMPHQELAKQVIREVILPEIEKEVNEGKNFATLRQMFYSMILATWYKKALKDVLLNQVYTDKAKTSGVLSDDPAMGEKIYQQYLEAYKKGVFNYIKDDKQSPTRGHSAPLQNDKRGSVSPSTLPAELATDMKATQGADQLPYQGEPRHYFSGGLALMENGIVVENQLGNLNPVENAMLTENADFAMASVEIKGMVSDHVVITEAQKKLLGDIILHPRKDDNENDKKVAEAVKAWSAVTLSRPENKQRMLQLANIVMDNDYGPLAKAAALEGLKFKNYLDKQVRVDSLEIVLISAFTAINEAWNDESPLLRRTARAAAERFKTRLDEVLARERKSPSANGKGEKIASFMTAIDKLLNVMNAQNAGDKAMSNTSKVVTILVILAIGGYLGWKGYNLYESIENSKSLHAPSPAQMEETINPEPAKAGEDQAQISGRALINKLPLLIVVWAMFVGAPTLSFAVNFNMLPVYPGNEMNVRQFTQTVGDFPPFVTIEDIAGYLKMDPKLFTLDAFPGGVRILGVFNPDNIGKLLAFQRKLKERGGDIQKLIPLKADLLEGKLTEEKVSLVLSGEETAQDLALLLYGDIGKWNEIKVVSVETNKEVPLPFKGPVVIIGRFNDEEREYLAKILPKINEANGSLKQLEANEVFNKMLESAEKDFDDLKEEIPGLKELDKINDQAQVDGMSRGDGIKVRKVNLHTHGSISGINITIPALTLSRLGVFFQKNVKGEKEISIFHWKKKPEGTKVLVFKELHTNDADLDIKNVYVSGSQIIAHIQLKARQESGQEIERQGIIVFSFNDTNKWDILSRESVLNFLKDSGYKPSSNQYSPTTNSLFDREHISRSLVMADDIKFIDGVVELQYANPKDQSKTNRNKALLDLRRMDGALQAVFNQASKDKKSESLRFDSAQKKALELKVDPEGRANIATVRTLSSEVASIYFKTRQNNKVELVLISEPGQSKKILKTTPANKGMIKVERVFVFGSQIIVLVEQGFHELNKPVSYRKGIVIYSVLDKDKILVRSRKAVYNFLDEEKNLPRINEYMPLPNSKLEEPKSRLATFLANKVDVVGNEVRLFYPNDRMAVLSLTKMDEVFQAEYDRNLADKQREKADAAQLWHAGFESKPEPSSKLMRIWRGLFEKGQMLNDIESVQYALPDMESANNRLAVQGLAVMPILKALSANLDVKMKKTESPLYSTYYQGQLERINALILVIEQKSFGDKAQAVIPGGIDLNAQNMGLDVTRQGNGVDLKFDQAMLDEFKQGNFTGVEGVILRIVPIQSPLKFLGV